MIGVIPKPGQVGVAEEFFELFKTPWELYRPEQTYEVVIATTDDVPEIVTKLLLICGSTRKNIDVRMGFALSQRYAGATLNAEQTALPIYGEVLTFSDNSKGTACLKANSEAAGLRICSGDSTVMRLGYDLFDEVGFLLSAGQPVKYAHIPTLDFHIGILRNWILAEGVPLLEIPPAPAGHSFAVCLTHDIDFAGIRNHKFDHSMWGFVYRATLGSLRNFFLGRISVGRLLKSWRALASLPFVYLGWAKDFWEPFEWYMEAEKGLPATYFLIPFKGRAGKKVDGPHASWRAVAYDLGELSHSIARLKAAGCELGVHGIDAWHSAADGREERARIEQVAGTSCTGIRMHWLLHDGNTFSVLEESGYTYDSTVGYNEAIGYRAGTGQVFRPLGAERLLELPVHIQDGALFYPNRMDLSEAEAQTCCHALMQNAKDSGGVLTMIWHDRSHGPERFWGDFYRMLLGKLRSASAWFATASQAVSWFEKRRQVRFERVLTANGVQVQPRYDGPEVWPPFKIRVYTPATVRSAQLTSSFADILWKGDPREGLASHLPVVLSTANAGQALS